LRWPLLGFVAGLAVTFIAVISAAAIALGAAGYLRALIDLPQSALTAAVVIAMGIVAAIGIKESMLVAGFFTVIEVLGLVAIIAGGFFGIPQAWERALETVAQTPETAAWPGIFAASLLGFFAFIGFENIVNMAEETHEPQKTLARAIFITLGLSTLLYVAVVLICAIAVPPAELAGQEAPLAFVFARVTGLSPWSITFIAVIATLNGVIAQIVMASRILYGLAERGHIPELWGRVHAVTRTPLIATGAITLGVLILALAFPIAALAAWTSRLTLGVILMVCLSLTVIKLRRIPAPPGTFIVPIWFPIFGMLAAAFLLVAGGL
jgi:APA family basic amino acid/polyamine antiporter